MPGESSERDYGELTPNQANLLEGFVGHYVEKSNLAPALTGYYDLASANVRDAVRKFELALDSPEEYYRVMVGLSIGTVWIEGLVADGHTVAEAAEIMRTSFARLFPEKNPPDIEQQI
jgi:hypothetical protein